ncbi:MAG: zinc-ribbon domain-containing protein, partial [Fidelibacterota bacterium]
EDFAQLAARYRSDAMSVLKQIDSLERGNGVLESSRGESASLDAGLQKSATTACAACGEEADPEDRFCSQCGKPLSLNRS